MKPEALRSCTLLLVDDEEANLDLLEAILESEGYRSIVRTSDSREVLDLSELHAPDLVLLDLHMPHRNGFAVLDDLRQRTPPDDYLPVLVLTADVTTEAKERALSSGARDFLTKPFDAVEVLLRVRNLLEARALHGLQRRARRQAEEAQARSALLAEVSKVLSTSLDGTTSLSRLPGLLVPDRADACSVHLITDGGPVAVAAESAHPGKAEELAARVAQDLAEALTTLSGQGPLVLRGAPGTQDPEVGWRLLAPIRVREVVGAVLTVICWGAEEGPTREELLLLEEIAARAGLALENARLFAEAERATRTRDRMLSVVAHDLRNPLAVVGVYGEMLLSMLPPEADEYSRGALASIHETTARLQRMVEDLLDASALEQGVLGMQPVAQPLRPLLLEAERMLRPLAERKEIELVFQGEPSAEEQSIPVDGTRFIQLLSNLGGNALKFTPPGGRVEVSWRSGSRELELTVSDTGPGIRPETIPHVFSAFWQAPDQERRGVGLGLWIARAIVEGHAGRIWVDSADGGGASFHVTLPIEGPTAGPQRVVARRRSGRAAP